MSNFLERLVRRSVAVHAAGHFLPRIDFWTTASSGEDTIGRHSLNERGRERQVQDFSARPIPQRVEEPAMGSLASPQLTAAASKGSPSRDDGVAWAGPPTPRPKNQTPGVTNDAVSDEIARQPDRPQAAFRAGYKRLKPGGMRSIATERSTLGQNTDEAAVQTEFARPARIDNVMPAQVQPEIAAVPTVGLSPRRPPGERGETVLSVDLRPAPVRPPAPTPAAPMGAAEPAAPVVQVHIGTVEVRARTANPAPVPPAPASRPTAGLGFDAYRALRTYRTWRDG